ncbi:hypothetical protein AGR4C_pa20005 [Agrobacterium tumefaciens str. Kerr 14]|uniref:Uncharacterized protein n=1 Tax=Agrobacterium tumefaciens str. Kerr 14 TaxID=1183424 RepID=A0A1S7SA18_AGRTU|nr:hypothetical protein AGR4C_pa20005 [Agrobacterium tumefaciens str. Kerr 14]
MLAEFRYRPLSLAHTKAKSSIRHKLPFSVVYDSIGLSPGSRWPIDVKVSSAALPRIRSNHALHSDYGVWLRSSHCAR